MSWMSDFQDASALRARAAQALHLQVGLASPLWLAYGAAASAGAAWWLMTRWTAPVNLEALSPPVDASPEPAAVELVEVAAAETAPATVEASEPVAVIVEPPLEPVAAAPALNDDLTVIVGVGPRSAEALMARGVTTFAALAAWTEAEMTAFDAELKLKGRSARNAWLDQARALAAQL